jgi:hypothetical protein
LSPGAFELPDAVIHNQSIVTGFAPMDITARGVQWAFVVSFPLRPEAFRSAGGKLLRVTVEAEVKSGRIGIGCVTHDYSAYLTTETDRGPEHGNSVLEIVVERQDGDGCAWLVVRNTAEGGAPSRVLIRSIRTFKTDVTRIPDLVDVQPLNIPMIPSRSEGPRGPESGETGRHFQLLLTHTSRSWDWTRCSREFLAQRAADPARLRKLPRFEDLPPVENHLYSGGLTVLDLAVDGDVAHVTARRCIDSRYKIQHANMVGSRLVLCFENFLAVLPGVRQPAEEVDLRPGSPWRIDDPWFSGLHTVFPVTDDICLVSSSGADAVLWVDLGSRRVIRRWRLPSEIYGFNYDLTPSMSVADHFIHNDIQLGHLNCAYPDDQGGCYVSTLFQGDIGHVDENGRYSLLARGQVGCHGIRVGRNGRDIYFADSCGGRLMRAEPGGGVTELWNADSRWLHDVEQVEADLYLFCLGDKNEIALVDLSTGQEINRLGLDCRGVNVQFVAIARM